MSRIVFVGQTPPPFHGQAIMIGKILSGTYRNSKLYHVPMSFSKEMDEIGKVNFSKVLHLIIVISKIYYYRVTKNADVLYYPPAGPNTAPVIRDIIILISTRWLFRRTIFHFHAGGVSQMTFRSGIMRWLFKLAYFHADCAILLSEFNPPDGNDLKAKKQTVIPYGIEDYSETFSAPRMESADVKILFVGLLTESKGVLVLLEAARLLKLRQFRFSVEIMGKFESKDFEKVVRAKVSEYSLTESVDFLGVLTGNEKLLSFKSADIFCFPTFYESETFGVVLLEAMQFSLPVVTTRWRGIPSIVTDDENGFLVEPGNAVAVADGLEKLIRDKSLRQRMGANGRKKFLDNFTLREFLDKMENIFANC